jgi:hypothetical protein
MNSPFTEVGFDGPGKQVESTLGYARIPSPLHPFGDMPDGGWRPENNPSVATSTPDYDDWGPDSWWTSSDWIIWHGALKRAYGLDEANRQFITAWENQSSLSAPIDARSFDEQFKNYARQNGFFDALFTGIGGLVGRVTSTTGDVVAGTTGAVSDVAGAVGTVGTLSKYLLPAAVVAFGFLYFMANAPKSRK